MAAKRVGAISYQFTPIYQIDNARAIRIRYTTVKSWFIEEHGIKIVLLDYVMNYPSF